MHDIHYPASITKIMTALLAIENCEMDEIATVPPEAFYEDHLIGQVDFVVDRIRTEGDSLKDTACEPLSVEKENKKSFLNWKHIIFAIIVGITIVGAFLIVLLKKCRSRNKGNKLASKLKRKRSRR